MKRLIQGLYIVAIMLGVFTVGLMARGDEPAKPIGKLAGWVHVIGCPHTSKITGQNNVVLFFDNGESVAIDINKTTEEKRANLSSFIGAVQGYTFVAKCEMAT